MARQLKIRNSVRREGKVLVLLAILLPTLLGVAGLVFDGGMMMGRQRDLQHAVDAAATAAARLLRDGNDVASAAALATELIVSGHNLAAAEVTVNIPPTSGPYAGQSKHVEVIAISNHESHFMHILNSVLQHEVEARAVAGVQDVTDGAAIVVLDPDPTDLTVSGIGNVLASINTVNLINAAVAQSGISGIVQSVPIVGPIVNNLLQAGLTNVLGTVVDDLWDQAIGTVSLVPLPTLIAGLEVEGLGRLQVDGAVLVNTEWGGEDENGEITGVDVAPPYGIACMPLVATTRIAANDVRVCGGVDNRNCYQAFAQGSENPLRAGRLPVEDPFDDLPVPSVVSDAGNIATTVISPGDVVQVALPTSLASNLTSSVLGQLSALLKPLFQPLIAPVNQALSQKTLQPGVYNSITVLSPLGGARFAPGIYIIRGTSPVTNMSLCIVGPVEATGVMFYITDSGSFAAGTGLPDANDDADTAPTNTLANTLPSALVLPLLSSARITGLNDASSPFDGMLIYQRRVDRRPIVLEAQQLLGGGDISGTVYSKWGHVVFVGGAGSYDLRFVAGTMRVVTATTTTLAPTELLPAAQDVLLLE
jgi:hypothetical protein